MNVECLVAEVASKADLGNAALPVTAEPPLESLEEPCPAQVDSEAIAHTAPLSALVEAAAVLETEAAVKLHAEPAVNLSALVNAAALLEPEATVKLHAEPAVITRPEVAPARPPSPPPVRGLQWRRRQPGLRGGPCGPRRLHDVGKGVRPPTSHGQHHRGAAHAGRGPPRRRPRLFGGGGVRRTRVRRPVSGVHQKEENLTGQASGPQGDP